MKRNRSHRKGVKTSTKEARKLAKKQKYASMRESARGSEDSGTVSGRGRAFTKSKHYCKHARRNERRAQTLERKAISDKLTPQQRLEKLDYMLGVGCGATKERNRLIKQIAAAN